MKVIKFEIEKSKINTQQFILVATVEDGTKFVVGSGSDHYVTPYENSWDTDTVEGHKVHNRFGMHE